MTLEEKVGKPGNIARHHKGENRRNYSHPKWRIGPKKEFMYSIKFV